MVHHHTLDPLLVCEGPFSSEHKAGGRHTLLCLPGFAGHLSYHGSGACVHQLRLAEAIEAARGCPARASFFGSLWYWSPARREARACH